MTDSFGHLETVLIDVAYVKRLQAENERLRAAFAPTIEVLERVKQWDYNGDGKSYNIEAELARLKAIVEKGTEL